MALKTSFSREIRFTLEGARIGLEVRVYEDGRFSVVGTFNGSTGQCGDLISAFYDESSAFVQPLADILAAWETFHLQPIPADELVAVNTACDALDGADFGTAPDLDNLKDIEGNDRIDSRDVAHNVEIYRAWARAKGYDLSKGLDQPDSPEIADDDVSTFEDACATIAFDEAGENYAADWKYGETAIAESDFENYAREMAEDCGMVNRDAAWPNNFIDWERAAEALKVDYTEIDFKGETYLVR